MKLQFLFRSDWTLAARGAAYMKLYESNVIFVKLHMRLQSTGFVLVVVLVPYKILISRARTSTKRIRLNRMHTPCALNLHQTLGRFHNIRHVNAIL